MTAIDRLKAAQTTDIAPASPTANPVDRLKGAQTVDSGIRVKAPTDSALEQASKARANALAAKEAERRREELERQRRQAQIDLDTAAINSIDAQLKQMRAEQGQQTFAGRVGDTIGAAASGTVGNVANAVGTAINAYNDPDSNRRRAESLRKVLETGYTTDGKAITPAMRYNIAQQIADLNADANRWEREDSTHNKLYNFADTVAKDTEKFTSSAKEGLGKVGQFAVDTGIAGAQLAGDIVASSIVPGSGLALMGTRAFGGAAQEARQDGATLGQQVAYGAGSAATSMLTEKLFNVAGPYAKAFGNGFFDKLVSRATKTAAGKMLLSAISEGGEEALESVVQPFLKNLTYSEGEKVNWNDVGYDALIGGLLGLVGGAGDVMTRSPNSDTQKPSGATQAIAEGTDAAAANSPQEASKAYSEQDVGSAPSDPLVQIMLGNSAPKSETGNKGETAHVIDVLSKNIPLLKNDPAVAQTSVGVIKTVEGATIAEKAKKLFDGIKGIISRPGLGEVEINGRSVKDDLSHGVGPAKAATISAIPSVIKNGKQVEFQENWKNRKYNGYIFAAPIIMDGETVYVAAVVKQTSKNRFYLHEVVDSNGNIIKIDDEESTNPTSLATESGAGVQSASSVEDIISNNSDSVKADNGANVVNAVGAAEQGFESDFSRLQNQSTEFYPEGANVTDKRAVDTPVKDFEGKTISRFANNALGADAISNETAAVIEQMVADGMLSDDVLHNRDALAQAEVAINKMGIDGAMEKLRQAAARKESSPELVAMMEALLIDAEAASTRNGERAAELVMIGAELSRSAARATQLLSHLRKMSPTYQLEAIRSSISNYVGKEIEESAGWKDLEQKFLNAPDADSRDAAISDMQQYVADNTKKSLGEKAPEWFTAMRYINMLGNLKTPGRNLIGNIANRAIYMVDNASIAVAEKLTRGKYGKTRSVFVSPELAAVGRADADNVAAKLYEGGKYAEGPMSANNFMRGVDEKRKTFGDIDLSRFGGKSYANPLEGAKTAVDWIMNNKRFGDKAFLRNGYGRFLAGYLKANNVTAAQWNDPAWQKANAKFVEKARDNSIRLAREAAFRQDNAFSEWVSKIGRRPDTPWYGRMASEGIAPFRKTPANVAVEIVEHSPIGIADAVIKGLQAKAGSVDKNGGIKADATDVIESAAKAVSGSALMGLGALLYASKLLSAGPGEDDEQAAFNDLVGKQDYAIQLPDGRSFTIDWLTPTATPLVAGAEIMRLMQEEGEGWDKFIDGLAAMSDIFIESSFVSGLKDTFDSVKYSDNNLVQVAMSSIIGYLTQGFTSTLGGQLERTFQPDSMMTYVDKNKKMPDFLQKAIGKTSAKLPGDYNQIPYINAWGETESEGDAMTRAINNLINPAYSSKTEMDGTEKEIQRLYNAVGGQYGSVFPTRADKYIEVSKSVYDPLLGKNISKSERKNLTAEEYVKYAQAKGQNSKKLVEQAVRSPEYRGMNDAEKAQLIDDMYGYANYKAKKAIIPTYSYDKYKKHEEAERIGLKPFEYSAYHEATKDFTSDDYTTRQEKFVAYIDSRNFTKEQKDWLYLLEYHSTNKDAAKAKAKDEESLRGLPWNR